MKKILIVDDSSYMRDVIKALLRNMDVSFIEASNGREAVDAYKEHNPDIVVMDMIMEVAGGLEAMREIHEHDKDAWVVVSSSLTGQDSLYQEAIKAGAKTVFTKPIDKNKFVAYIRETLNI
jgi:two-component system chemotaxis response regulator CheY